MPAVERGRTRRPVRALAVYGALLPLFLAACRPAPRSIDQAFLDRRIAEHEQTALQQRARLTQRFLDRLEYRQQELNQAGSSAPIEFNALLLSSGGQYGAFGVGVLDGWGDAAATGPLARPSFDVVTGVSTGALIAPFALSGTDYSIARVAELYKQADDSFAIVRGLLFFLPWRQSFFDNRNLRAQIAGEVDTKTITEIAEAHREHRMLLIGAVDLDLGRFHIWDMGDEAEQVLESQNSARFHDALLSSAAIPGAFPPVEIEGVMYVDGAAAQSTFFGLDREAINAAVRAFRERHPGAPSPVFRFWMIINGHLDVEPQIVEQRWVTIAGRSVAVMLSYSLRSSLRRMQFGMELIGQELGVPVEFRYIAIPPDVELPESQSRMFDRDLIAELHVVGYRLGSDPSSWRTEPIAPDIPGSTIDIHGAPLIAPSPSP